MLMVFSVVLFSILFSDVVHDVYAQWFEPGGGLVYTQLMGTKYSYSLPKHVIQHSHQ